MKLKAEGVSLGYRDRSVVENLSVGITEGTVTTIIGPNGCGKSTLLRALARLLEPRAGSISMDGRALGRIPSREVAKSLGILPQSPVAPEGLSVAELVSRGRYPHQNWYRQWSTADDEAVTRALELTAMDQHAGHMVDELSGGQRQRAWIAMTLAQETGLVLLDEPITYLDLAHQVEVLDLIHRLNKDRGTTVVMVLHDLNLAARYSDTLIAMRDGAILAQGKADEVITEPLLDDIFGLSAHVVPDPVMGTPMVVPLSAHLDALGAGEEAPSTGESLPDPAE